jgi:hypothetical protein
LHKTRCKKKITRLFLKVVFGNPVPPAQFDGGFNGPNVQRNDPNAEQSLRLQISFIFACLSLFLSSGRRQSIWVAGSAGGQQCKV